jgi:hypothetical protein
MSRPSRQTWAYSATLLLGLGVPGAASAVQLSTALLPLDAPWALPSSPPLAGLEQWRLQGVFRQRGGAGWALLSTEPASVLRVEPGAVLQDGIQLEAIEDDGVWLRRGQHRTYLRLGGSAQSIASTEYAVSLSPVAEIPTQACQLLMAGGVPIDELTALGACPGRLD